MLRPFVIALLLAVLGGCALARPEATSAPEPSPAPTRTRRPTTTPAPSPTPAPSATPAPPALLVDAGAEPVIALGPADPTDSYLTLTRAAGIALLPLGQARAPAPFVGAPAGWSSDGRLLAYLAERPGAVKVWDRQLRTGLPLVGPDERVVAGGWVSGRGRFLFLADHDGLLALRQWSASGVSELVALGPGRPAGGASLAISPVGGLAALPIVVERAGEPPRAELLIVDLTQGMTATLTTAPGDHQLSVAWSPSGELAFSAGGPVSVYNASTGKVALLGGDGRPQEWGVEGLLLISPAGELLLARPGQQPGPIVPGLATPAQAAHWLRPGEVTLLRDGSVYRLKVPG